MITTSPLQGRPGGHYGLSNVLRSEWTKFVSLRSSQWTLLTFLIFALGVDIVVAHFSGTEWPGASAETRAAWDSTSVSLAGIVVGAFLLPVLGVLTICGEYSSGSIRSTLAAVPRRILVLAAKTMVFGISALVVSEAAAFAMFFGAQLAIGNAPHASLTQPDVLRAVMLSGAYVTLMGVFGLGIGTIVRHTGWAIAVYAGLAMLSSAVLLPLPGNLWRFAPINLLGNSIATTRVPPGFPGPWVAFGMMGLLALAALVLGGMVLVRRDA